MEEGITFVGIDAHKAENQAAMLLAGRTDFVEWSFSNDKATVQRMVKKVMHQAPRGVRFCYEAGPCGYAMQRWIHEVGAHCVVVAPSMIPRKPGERIKTNRRDARKLAQLDRAGLLTEVQPPSEEDEAVRDLCRARNDARQDLVRCRHRLSKFLLRHGVSWSQGKRAWSSQHRLWLKTLRFARETEQNVFDDYLVAVEQIETRLQIFDAQIEKVSQLAPYAEPVGALRCFRGIDTTTAMGIVTELYSFVRFETPRGLMAFLGLVPSESSSGDKHSRGSITKAGNSHVRRLLIEAAWHYRHRPNPARLKLRRHGQSARVVALADKAMNRLYRRFTRMQERGKARPKIVVAIARELAGFVWATLRPLSVAQ